MKQNFSITWALRKIHKFTNADEEDKLEEYFIAPPYFD
jgi:hypothetical protein